jgi:NADPH-dependent 2,4-dienoyl-CoA reductase/sulfur reductase-like enzyme
VALVDERPALGGQIYKRVPAGFHVPQASAVGDDYVAGERLIAEVASSEIATRVDTTAWGIWDSEVALHTSTGSELVTAKQIVLATGAYDRPVVFPGWTLPGVLTAGGAQSLTKVQRVLPGHRILMVGTGPLLLAFAAQLHQLGANIVEVCDANPPPKTEGVRLAWAARGRLGTLRRGLRYHAYLRRNHVPYRYSQILTRVEGSGCAEAATLAQVDRDWRPINGSARTLEVDTVCVGYGFLPSNELSILSGCEHEYDDQLGGLVPARDRHMRSLSTPHVFIAGDGAGVEGVDVARAEGTIAGLAAAASVSGATTDEVERIIAPARTELRAARRFGRALRHAFPVTEGAYALAQDDTVVCRCEGVTQAAIWKAAEFAGADANGVKNVTRAGMGLCQGRNCSAHVRALVARRLGVPQGEVSGFNPRPPVKPIPISALTEIERIEDREY